MENDEKEPTKDNGTKKGKKGKGEPKGMGYVPYFNDYSVYSGVKLMAGQRKLKTQSLILEIVQNHYMVLMGHPLNILEAEQFHKQIVEASKKQKTRDVPDFIEYCCSKYLEKAVESLKPQVKRG
jgi:hypothetical protein